MQPSNGARRRRQPVGRIRHRARQRLGRAARAAAARRRRSRRTVVNASISGDTTSGGRSRLPALLSAAQADARDHRARRQRCAARPAAGDDARQPGRDGARRARPRARKVLLVGMQVPPNYGRSYSEEFAAMFASVAKAEGAALVPFLLAGVADAPNAAGAVPGRSHPPERAGAPDDRSTTCGRCCARCSSLDALTRGSRLSASARGPGRAAAPGCARGASGARPRCASRCASRCCICGAAVAAASRRAVPGAGMAARGAGAGIAARGAGAGRRLRGAAALAHLRARRRRAACAGALARAMHLGSRDRRAARLAAAMAAASARRGVCN